MHCPKRKWENAMSVVKSELIDDVKRKYVKDPLFTTLFIIFYIHQYTMTHDAYVR
jgi:hypothetical protein